MLTVRSLPRRGVAERNRLLAVYRDGMLRHWSRRERLLAAVMRQAGLGGWSAQEVRLLPATVRMRGLSMADRRGIHRLVNGAAPSREADVLRNKQQFARHMLAAGLPVPDTYLPERGSASEWLARQQGIILKPSFSSKGRGVVRFARIGGTGDWSGPECLAAAALADRIERFAARLGCAQAAIETAPGIAALSPGALPTLRLVTCLDEYGLPEVAAAAMRLSRSAANPVDNFNAGNLVCSVSADARLGPALAGHSGSLHRFDTHPETRAAIKGAQVTGFAACEMLARAAHRSVARRYAVVGWDIGIAPEGPVLIEGNWNPGTDIIQLVTGRGVDETRLGELYRWHLKSLPPESWRSARPVQFDG